MKAKNEKAIVKVQIFGQDVEEFKIKSDDDLITTDVITGYINTQIGDDETRSVSEEILRCLAVKTVESLIHNFNDKGDFLRDILDIAVVVSETEKLKENAKRLKRCVYPLLGRIYFDETNKLSKKEQRIYGGFQTAESVVSVLIARSWIDDGIMTFSAEI